MTFKNYTNENKLQHVNHLLREAIGKYFNYSFNFEFLDQVAAVIDKIGIEELKEALEADQLEELIYITVDNEILYGDQKFILLYEYCDPEYPDYDSTIEYFRGDILEILKKYYSGLFKKAKSKTRKEF